MKGARNVNFLSPPPGALGRGQKSLNFNYKVNFKDFYSKLCLCSRKWKIQNISDGVFILSPGSCPRGGTRGYLQAKIKFGPAVCLLCYLLLNHWKKFTQIWCVSYSHEWGVQPNFFPRLLEPWGGVKRSNIIKFQLQSQFQRFLFQTLFFVLANERYKTYQTGFLFCRLGHALGVGLGGTYRPKSNSVLLSVCYTISS